MRPTPRGIMTPRPYITAEFTRDTFEIKPDCRHYDGGLPCVHQRPCHGCLHHDPVTSRWLIVLLEALGDILITSPLAARIKAEDPGAHITWLVRDYCAPLVRLNPHVDRVLVYDWESVETLRSETYDVVLGLERVRGASSLVTQINASRKVGIGHGGRHNSLEPLDSASKQIFMLDTWNDYRTHLNDKSWTELYFDIAGFDYRGEDYVAEVPAEQSERVREWFDTPHTGGWVCLSIGGSFRQKEWPDSHWYDLAVRILRRGLGVFLMGGPGDRGRLDDLQAQLFVQGVGDQSSVLAPQTDLAEACAVPAHCRVMVSNDSFGYHAAILNGVPSVVLFGPSTPAEVLLPGSPPMVPVRSSFGCSPCALQMTCGGVGGCMDDIGVEDVYAALTSLLDGAGE